MGSRGFDDTAKRRVVRLVAKGKPLSVAAETVGFTISTVKRHLDLDQSFKEAVAEAVLVVDDKVEGVWLELALDRKNLSAVQSWLYNRRPDRWRDQKTIRQEISGPNGGPIQIAQAHAIALREVLSDPDTRADALRLVRSIDVASRDARASGQDGDPSAFFGEFGSGPRRDPERALPSAVSE